MVRRTLHHLLALLLPITFGFVVSSVAFAQKMPKVEPFGIDGFRLMLQQQGLEATQTGVGSAFDHPTETVLVLIGDLSPALSMRGQVNKFLHEGGAALVATDGGGQEGRTIPWPSPTGNTVFRFIRPFRVRDRSECYQGHTDCPIVTEFEYMLPK